MRSERIKRVATNDDHEKSNVRRVRDEDGMTPWVERFGGHLWTIAPLTRQLLPGGKKPVRQEVSITVVDEQYGPTRLSGSFCDRMDSDSVVVLVHGLGGSRQAAYVQRAAATLLAGGFATMSVDLRGADRRGGGFYHVALEEDLRAVCRAPSLRRFHNVFVLGFSMGGHVALHYAAAKDERRLRGVAALCTPLNLQATQQHLDQRSLFVYRHYVLRGLKQIYAAVARKHDVPSPNRDVQRCRTFHEWDRLTIAPRYDYESPEHFYRERSAATVLGDLAVDTVMVLARNDPIVPPQLVLPYIANAPFGKLHVKVLPRGGHLQFAGGQSLGFASAQTGDVISQLAAHWHRLIA